MLQKITSDSKDSGSFAGRELYPGFSWGICRRPIRYRHRWHRDLLIRAALDPAIDAVEPDNGVEILGGLSFLIRRGSSTVRVVAVHDDRTEPAVGRIYPIILVTRAIVRSDPVMTDARAVWAARHHPVSAGDRIRILSGFDQKPEYRLRDLATLARDPKEGVDIVLAMACSGQLSICLSEGLSPDMKVRRRQAISKEPGKSGP